ncbi:hypothetical protein K9N68_05800 [Kovacikia minuta CCNUW1]|uniref:hypothetical protein n=1 Tax=Kovacikia minuta TaxID=2931930 RepID=UPI001CCA43A5|nr:hypothetical protein [Kovacikia minuta]UBF27459.1 hypothetical protein K9N68_05800 [Kovacikia minuta CCNUW1]
MLNQLFSFLEHLIKKIRGWFFQPKYHFDSTFNLIFTLLYYWLFTLIFVYFFTALIINLMDNNVPPSIDPKIVIIKNKDKKSKDKLPQNFPDSATFINVRYTVEVLPGSDRTAPRKAQYYLENNQRLTRIQEYPDIVRVAGTTQKALGKFRNWFQFGNWAQLRLWKGSSPVSPIVQAGPDSTATEYTFPCRFTKLGQAVILWGIKREEDASCIFKPSNLKADKIKADKNTTLFETAFLQKEVRPISIVRMQLFENKIFQYKFAQTDENSNTISDLNQQQIIVSGNASETLVYIHRSNGSFKADVLTGSAIIQAGENPRKIVREDSRFTYRGYGDRGKVSQIDSKEVAKTEAVQIFLNTQKSPDIDPVVERLRLRLKKRPVNGGW